MHLNKTFITDATSKLYVHVNSIRLINIQDINYNLEGMTLFLYSANQYYVVSCQIITLRYWQPTLVHRGGVARLEI